MSFYSFKDKLEAIQFANEQYAKGHNVRLIELSSKLWRVCVAYAV
jgi:hypothetical protein